MMTLAEQTTYEHPAVGNFFTFVTAGGGGRMQEGRLGAACFNGWDPQTKRLPEALGGKIFPCEGKEEGAGGCWLPAGL